MSSTLTELRKELTDLECPNVEELLEFHVAAESGLEPGDLNEYALSHLLGPDAKSISSHFGSAGSAQAQVLLNWSKSLVVRKMEGLEKSFSGKINGSTHPGRPKISQGVFMYRDASQVQGACKIRVQNYAKAFVIQFFTSKMVIGVYTGSRLNIDDKEGYSGQGTFSA